MSKKELRRSGISTGQMLTTIGEAILNKGKWVEYKDHFIMNSEEKNGKIISMKRHRDNYLSCMLKPLLSKIGIDGDSYEIKKDGNSIYIKMKPYGMLVDDFGVCFDLEENKIEE